MIENIGNVKEEYLGAPPQKIKLSLGYDVNAKVYRRGKEINGKIKNGECNFSLKVGEAVFVEIIE
jgi:hypothetical protein